MRGHFDILARPAANTTSCASGSGGHPDRLLAEDIEMPCYLYYSI